MTFSRRRGRPRKQDNGDTVDRGTPELQRRQRLNLTAEPIDLLYQHGMIDLNEHWAGLHFRWLYTLRYGSASPQSLDPARVKGLLHKKPYDEWQQQVEREWRSATELLERQRLLAIIMDVCIHNNTSKIINKKQIIEKDIKSALILLCQLWIKPCRKQNRFLNYS